MNTARSSPPPLRRHDLDLAPGGLPPPPTGFFHPFPGLSSPATSLGSLAGDVTACDVTRDDVTGRLVGRRRRERCRPAGSRALSSGWLGRPEPRRTSEPRESSAERPGVRETERAAGGGLRRAEERTGED